jgi:hypothetical protein
MSHSKLMVLLSKIMPTVKLPSSSSPSATTSASSSPHCFPSSGFLDLHTRSIINKKSVEIQTVRENVVSDIVATNTEMVKCDRVFPSQRQLHCLQMSIHADVHTCDGAMHYSSILQLYRHRLIVKLHQKPDELHAAKKPLFSLSASKPKNEQSINRKLWRSRSSTLAFLLPIRDSLQSNVKVGEAPSRARQNGQALAQRRVHSKP